MLLHRFARNFTLHNFYLKLFPEKLNPEETGPKDFRGHFEPPKNHWGVAAMGVPLLNENLLFIDDATKKLLVTPKGPILQRMCQAPTTFAKRYLNDKNRGYNMYFRQNVRNERL